MLPFHHKTFSPQQPTDFSDFPGKTKVFQLFIGWRNFFQPLFFLFIHVRVECASKMRLHVGVRDDEVFKDAFNCIIFLRNIFIKTENGFRFPSSLMLIT